MFAIADNTRNERSHLRLVHDSRRSILIAGGDEHARGELMDELSDRLPEGTSFEQADAMWELLERAPGSRIVMLAGELDDGSTESVISLLGNRHPQLPVLALGEPAATAL